MLLGDMGAEIVRIERPATPVADARDYVGRSRSSVVQLDLKDAEGRAQALQLVAAADALVEGFRPGVMERLGLGPDLALKANPKLVYGRMTGWGQDGRSRWRPGTTSTTSPSPARSPRWGRRATRRRRR
jgi:alpha-methylacyl-CoA racemase